MKLTNIRLLTDNFEEMFDFYHDILKVTCVFGERQGVYADFDFDGTYLSLFDKQLMAEALKFKDFFGNEDNHSQIIIIEADNLENLYNALKSEVKVIDEPTEQQAWGIKCFHVCDPDGNLIEFYKGL